MVEQIFFNTPNFIPKKLNIDLKRTAAFETGLHKLSHNNTTINTRGRKFSTVSALR